MANFIGGKLKKMRKEKGWSQEQTADFLCVSQSAYARMERGGSNSWATSLTKISEVFDVTLEELFRQDNILATDANNQQSPNLANACFFYEMSKKLMEQYEVRLKEKDEIIAVLLKERG